MSDQYAAIESLTCMCIFSNA